MENLYKKIDKELHSLSEYERNEILLKLRNEVDNIDKDIVRLLSKRTLHSILIGRIKRSLGMQTYSPVREKDVSRRVSSIAEEPLRPEAVLRIYERILDESRAIQREEANKGNLYRIFNQEGKISFKNILSKKEFLLISSFFLLLVLWFYWIFFTPNYNQNSDPQLLLIKKGMTFSQITDSLYEKKIIPNKTPFRIAAFIYGAEEQLKAARYHIPNGLSYLDVLNMMREGKGDQLRAIYLYNGLTINAIANRLEAEKITIGDSLRQIAINPVFLKSLNINSSSPEGYFLPGNYDFYENSSAKEILQTLNDSLNAFLDASLLNVIKRKNLSLHKVLTVASIIEGETNFTQEMPRIAGVYYNRLRIGMKLQADPTVQYLQNGGWKRLMYSDLKVDNVYNTYKYFGLPPGPINNPGKDAILAAIYPENNKYLFFVADGTGKHVFGQTYSDHLRNVKDYRKWLKNQKK